jgi:intein-encoded DNA endonuclease-like protein
LACVKEDIDYFYSIFKTTGEYNLYYRKRENRREQGLINCSSLELSNFLKSNDYLIKSVASPTKILLNIPEEFQSYFYLGFSDGDGCFYYNTKKNNDTICNYW